MKKYKGLIILSIICLCSCHTSKMPVEVNPYTPFTCEVEGRLNSQQMQKVQFYNSETIELRRELQSGEAGVSAGEIHLIDGKYYQIVEIPKLTPGVCLKSEHDYVNKYGGTVIMDAMYHCGDVYISFDNTNRTIRFWAIESHNGDYSKHYLIAPDDVDDSYGIYGTNFDGHHFEIVKGNYNSSEAELVVKKDAKRDTTISREVLKGRTIDK